MKKLINEPLAVVDEMLEGLCLAHPGLALLEGERVLVRADLAAFRDRGHVALVSGGRGRVAWVIALSSSRKASRWAVRQHRHQAGGRRILD